MAGYYLNNSTLGACLHMTLRLIKTLCFCFPRNAIGIIFIQNIPIYSIYKSTYLELCVRNEFVSSIY